MNGLRTTVQSFVAGLHTYDYVFFSASATLFLLLLVLAILFRHKLILSLILVLLSFSILIAGPIVGYNYVHTSLYKNEITDLEIKALEFSEAVVIKGHLTNLGQQAFSQCKISAKAYKGPTNFLEEIVLPFKPFLKMSILKKEPLEVNEGLNFKMILEPFTYTNDYNISVKASCL